MFLLHGSFGSAVLGHGGNQRSAQVRELIQQANVSIGSLEPHRGTFLQRFRETLECLRLAGRVPRRLRTVKGYSMLLKRIGALARNRHIKAVITEGAYWDPIPIIASGKLPFLAIPQNIESFVLGQSPALGTDLFEDFASEGQILGRAVHCFCICEEDAAIVEAFCRNVSILSYYPPKKQLEFLLRVREMRQGSAEKTRHTLVLGSATNPPTQLGMIRLLEHIRDYGNYGRKIILAGFGTESLSTWSSPSVEIVGAVSSAKLEQLLIGAGCLLVEHSATTGSLTRIVDSLVAGIPVVANRFAIRGHAFRSGIDCYKSLAEGLSLAASDSLPFPSLPERPTLQEAEFIDTLTAVQRAFPA